MRLFLVIGIVIATLSSSLHAQESSDSVPEWKAGAASVVITPERPLRMAGYAGRTDPADGTVQDLFAKCVTIEDQQGQRIAIITLDLIGVLADLRSAVVEQLGEKYRLLPQAVLMNASHTHCGPAYGREDAKDYFEQLTRKIVQVVGESIDRLQPVTLSYSVARASVAMNRRTPSATGVVNHPNPLGPVDHSVPVLSVRNPAGELQTVIFGYACHNTTMGFLKWYGDYAGYAQEYLEADHPGVTALFMMGCGGDQNPYPRSDLKYAKHHGRTLATAVEAALEVNQRSLRHQHAVSGPLRFALETVDLQFAVKDRPDFAYPVQAIRFGNDVTLIALGTEVVVDYSLRLKSELSHPEGSAIWVAGYSNVYSGYIPSRRVLLEGGYEARSRPWNPNLEERIVRKVHDIVGRLKVTPDERQKD